MNIGLARLKKEYKISLQDPTPGILAEPDPKNWFTWHFVFFDLPSDTPYARGCYHGELRFPLAYPNAPPDILMHTPSGRLEVETKICTSFSSFHPESWSPSWNVQTILKGIVSFFLGDEGGTGTTRASNAMRRRLAAHSNAHNLKNHYFIELFQEKLEKMGKDLTCPTEDPVNPQESHQFLICCGVVLVLAALIGKYVWRTYI